MSRFHTIIREVLFRCVLGVLFIAPSLPSSAASTRIKDISDFEGVRENMLVGYGLVVGLNGTGDSLNKAVFTKESIVGMLERMGISARGNNLNTKNIAAVMVTATLPAFSRQGSKIDVNVSAIGDAGSLLGGTLLVTPLMGADGEAYAVAQGSIATGGFSAKGQGASITKGVPTSGRIASGAIVERELQFDLAAMDRVRLSLKNPDFTTARRVAQSINMNLGGNVAKAADSATIDVQLSGQYLGDPVGLMTQIEQLPVETDTAARVVIDEQSGIIVIGENVKINTVAIAQGNLTIKITETPQVSQPNPLAEGQTVTVPRTTIEVDEDPGKQLALVQGVSLQELVSGLNALGVGPRDMISILQAIKAAGALQADIEVM